MTTPSQAIFVRGVLFNFVSVIYWLVTIAVKNRQVDIDNAIENAKPVMHDYAIGDQVYVGMAGIYHKLDYKKQGPYRITELFSNGTVQIKQRQVNGHINIRRLKPHCDE